MFAIIGLLLSLVGVSFKATRLTVLLAAHLLGYGLVGYILYEFIVGVTQGRQASAKAEAASPAAAPEPEMPHAPEALRAVLSGPAKEGAPVHVTDAGGIEHTTRVGRGVIRR